MKKYNYILETHGGDYVGRGSVNWAKAIVRVNTSEELICSMYDIELENDKRRIKNASKRKYNTLCPILVRESHNGHCWSTLNYFLKKEVDTVLENDL